MKKKKNQGTVYKVDRKISKVEITLLAVKIYENVKTNDDNSTCL